MGLMDKLKDIINVPEDDYYDDIPESDEIFSSSSRQKERERDNRDRDERQPVSSELKKNKVVNIHATTQLQVVLVKPERFEEATTIADHLNGKRTVVLNLEATGKDIARRLVDFLSGVAYANDGQMKRVANSTFIVTPFNVDLVGDLLLDELESTGVRGW